MKSHKLILKIFLENPAALTDAQAVPIFHSWIQSHALAEHLLIDVADYAHVHQGPGTLLVTHEANLALDHAGGRSGLLYQRKQPIANASTPTERMAAVFKYTLTAARLLEEAAPSVKFKTDEFQFRVADRLNAPNTRDTFVAVGPEIELFAANLLGEDNLELTFDADPASLFTVTIRSRTSTTVGDLLAKLG